VQKCICISVSNYRQCRGIYVSVCHIIGQHRRVYVSVCHIIGQHRRVYVSVCHIIDSIEVYMYQCVTL